MVIFIEGKDDDKISKLEDETENQEKKKIWRRKLMLVQVRSYV